MNRPPLIFFEKLKEPRQYRGYEFVGKINYKYGQLINYLFAFRQSLWLLSIEHSFILNTSKDIKLIIPNWLLALRALVTLHRGIFLHFISFDGVPVSSPLFEFRVDYERTSQSKTVAWNLSNVPLWLRSMANFACFAC